MKEKIIHPYCKRKNCWVEFNPASYCSTCIDYWTDKDKKEYKEYLKEKGGDAQ